MRFILAFLVLVLINSKFFTQNNLILFSEKGELFLVKIHDKQINEVASSNVHVNNLGDPKFQLRIFSDSTTMIVNQTIHLLQNGKPTNGYDFYYMLVKRKNKYSLKFQKRSKSPVLLKEELVAKNDSGLVLCKNAISNEALEAAKSTIDSKQKEVEKENYIKHFVSLNCLNCNQLKQLIGLLTFEYSKLSIAKFAYKYAMDKSNYGTLNALFGKESSIQELEHYINSIK